MFTYSDFPGLGTEEDVQFPTASMVMEYLEAYTDEFGLREKIEFETEVLALRRPSPPQPQSVGWGVVGWDATLQRHGAKARTEHFDAVAVCSGLDHVPRARPITGEECFEGTIVHSSDYAEASIFEGRRVVLCGLGPSCVDISTDSSRVAASTLVAYKHCPKFFPRMVTADLNVEAFVSNRLYEAAEDALGAVGLEQWGMRCENALWKRFYGGDLHEFNIAPFEDAKNYKNGFTRAIGGPPPQLLLLQICPSYSWCFIMPLRLLVLAPPRPADDWSFLEAIRARRIEIKQAHVAAFERSGVRFTDGSRRACDVVVKTSGFSPGLSMLDPAQLQQHGVLTDEGLALYKDVFHPALPDLGFVGFVFCESTLVEGEMQGRWFAAVTSGRAALPATEAMGARIAEQVAVKQAEQSPFVKRLVTEPQFIAYLDDIAAEAGCLPPWWLKWRHPLCWWLGIQNPFMYRICGTGAMPDAVRVWKRECAKHSLVNAAQTVLTTVGALGAALLMARCYRSQQQ